MFTFAIFREMIRRSNLIQTKVKYQMKMIYEQIIFRLIGTSTPTATVKSISRRKFTIITVVITLTKLLSRRHRWLHIITRIRYVQIVEFIEIVIRSLFLVNQYQKQSRHVLTRVMMQQVEYFCSDDQMMSHNYDAPTPHNSKCGSRSTWSVIINHADFADNKQTVIMFTIARVIVII